MYVLLYYLWYWSRQSPQETDFFVILLSRTNHDVATRDGLLCNTIKLISMTFRYQSHDVMTGQSRQQHFAEF